MPTTQVTSNSGRPFFTTMVEDIYNEMNEIKVESLGRSFFKPVFSQVRQPAWVVQRGSEKVAANVVLGHQGNRFEFSKSTLKTVTPFYYRDFFDATTLEMYFLAFNKGWNINVAESVANGVAEKMKIIRDTIERANELYSWQVIEDGSCVSVSDGTTVDFGRKGASIVDLGAGNYWDTAGTDPFVDMKAGGDFLRQTGKYGGYYINVVMASNAWSAFRNNTKVQDRLKQFNNRRDTLPPSQLNSVGGIYQGEYDVDGYIIRIFTYNQFFDDYTTGVSTPYITPGKIYMMPDQPGDLIYGATPQFDMGKDGSQNTLVLKSGDYQYSDYMDWKNKTHEFHIESACMPTAKKIDQFYTLRVLGA